MPYHNLYCSDEKTYRWHTVTDIKEDSNPILQSIIKQVKNDIISILNQIEGVTAEKVKELMEGYTPHVIGIQTIYCPSCKHLQTDVIINDQTKLREDLWRYDEADRFVKQFMRDR